MQLNLGSNVWSVNSKLANHLRRSANQSLGKLLISLCLRLSRSALKIFEPAFNPSSLLATADSWLMVCVCLRLYIIYRSESMRTDLMSLLPVPKCEEDAYGADHLANFHELLWSYVLIPLLMTDEINCAHLFVKLFTVHEYGNSAGEIDTTEKRIRDVINGGSQSNLFFIKGQSPRGCDADDHSLTVQFVPIFVLI